MLIFTKNPMHPQRSKNQYFLKTIQNNNKQTQLKQHLESKQPIITRVKPIIQNHSPIPKKLPPKTTPLNTSSVK